MSVRMYSSANDSSERFMMDVDELEWMDVYAALCNNEQAETVASYPSNVLSVRPRMITNNDHLMPLRCVLTPPTPTPTPPPPSPRRHARVTHNASTLHPSFRFAPVSAPVNEDSTRPQWVHRQPKQTRSLRYTGAGPPPVPRAELSWATPQTSRDHLSSCMKNSYRGHARSSSVSSATPSDSTASSISSLPQTPSGSLISLDRNLHSPPRAKSYSKSILTRTPSKQSATSTAKSVTFADVPVIHQEIDDWDGHPFSIRHGRVDEYEGRGLIFGSELRSPATPKPHVRRSFKGLIFGDASTKEPVRPTISQPLALGSLSPSGSSSRASIRSTSSSQFSGRSGRQTRGKTTGVPLRGTPSMDSLKSTDSKRSMSSSRSYFSHTSDSIGRFKGWMQKVGLKAG